VVWPYEDGDYPDGYFLAQGTEPISIGRGGYKPREYARRHGEAIVHYASKVPFYVDNILLPDGSRGRVGQANVFSKRYRRPLTHIQDAWVSNPVHVPIKWRWGLLSIEPDDVIFVEAPDEPTIHIYEDLAALQWDLYGKPEIKSLADSYVGAVALYYVLRNADWTRGDERPCCTSDGAALIVSHIRGLGETLFDFWPLDLDRPTMDGAIHFFENYLRKRGWTNPHTFTQG
jgi:hypothetical protein